MRCKVKSDTCQSKRTGKKEEVCVSSDKKWLIHLGVLWLFSQRGPPCGREVKNHRVESLKPGYHRIPNRCIDRRQCQLHHVCPKERCYRQCNTCYQRNEYRMKFREERCPKLQWHSMCAMAAGKRTGVRSGNSSMFTIQRKKAIGKCWCAHAPEPALQKRKDCFWVNGLTSKFKKDNPSIIFLHQTQIRSRWEKRPCIATSMPVYFEPNAAIYLVPVETCKTKRTKMMSPRPPRKRF